MSEPNIGKQSPEADSSSPRKVARRQALLIFGIVLNAIAGTLFAIPIVGYVLSPGSRRSMQKDLGWVSLGEGDIPCWVRRISEEKWQVFAVNCAHLGCPVRWFPQSGLFMCPCHGGVYYADGARASGPPPRGLFQYDYKIETGKLWIKAGQMPTLAQPASVASAKPSGGCSCA